MATRGQLAFTDPEEVQARIDEYFASLWKERRFTARGDDGKPVSWTEEYMEPPTMAGLALALDVTRVTLMHWGKGAGERDADFIPIIARAKTRIAEYAEKALYTKEGSNGAKFALEVNHRYGREDETERGGAFVQKVIAPAPQEETHAIPKWEPGGDGDED